jgi:protein SCO1/2
MKFMGPLPIIGALLAALTAIGAIAWVAWTSIERGQTSEGGATPATARPAVSIGGPFQLVDHTGKTVTAADYRGRFMLIFFGYGYCPDVCPTELATMAAALDVLGKRAEKIQPLFISVDPARDTPKFLADYVANFHPRLVGLTGTADQVAAAAKAYRVFYAKSKQPEEQPESTAYFMDHSAFVYLMGPDGSYRTMFRRSTSPKIMAGTIAGILDQSASK